MWFLQFLLRLEHFARESVRRQEELTQRVKSEVAEVCEKQMASLHRLDTRRRPTTENGEEGDEQSNYTSTV